MSKWGTKKLLTQHCFNLTPSSSLSNSINWLLRDCEQKAHSHISGSGKTQDREIVKDPQDFWAQHMKSWPSYLFASVLTALIFRSVQDQSVKDGKNTSQTKCYFMWHSGIRGKNPAHSPGDFSFYSYFSSDCHKNESVMQSVTITGNSLTLLRTLKLVGFFQVMRNFTGEQNNKIKTFYCFMFLIHLTIYITFVP